MLILSQESKNSVIDEIIQSNNAERVFVNGLGLVQSIKETVVSSCAKFDSIPSFLPGQITSCNLGSLENVPIRGEINIIKQFDTEISVS